MNTPRTDLQQRLVALIARGVQEQLRDGEFDRLAREVFAFQFERNGVYRAYCEQQKITPDSIADWKQIPAVPTSAFKDFALTCFPVAEAVAEFHTSGTTNARSGKHYFRTLELYEAAIRPNFAAHLLADEARLPMLALTPSPGEAPHSSLSHMMGLVMRDCGAPGSKFYVEDGKVRVGELGNDLKRAQGSDQPVFLLGTAFAFVQFFDYCAQHKLRFRSADGSRAMETGGFKGRSREMSKKELYAQFETVLGIPAARVVNEYGMTELSTQFYDESMIVGSQCDVKSAPPWARVLVIDPNTGKEAAIEEVGLIRVYDLANLWSTMCVQTEDLGRARRCETQSDLGKFEVLGRAAGAEVRGCSLNAETFSVE